MWLFALGAGGLQVLPQQSAVESAGGPVVIEVRGDVAPAGRLSAQVNLGHLEPPEKVAPGRWTLTYHPPALPHPAVAVIVATLGTGEEAWHAAGRIALLATAEVKVTTLPGADVEIEVAGRRFGPRTADQGGMVVFALPGIGPEVTGYTVIATHRSGRTTRRLQRWTTPSSRRFTVGPVARLGGRFVFAVAAVRANGEPQSPARMQCRALWGAALEQGAAGDLALFSGRLPGATTTPRVVECQVGRQKKRVELPAVESTVSLAAGTPVDPAPVVASSVGAADAESSPLFAIEPLVGVGVLANNHGNVAPLGVVGVELGGEVWAGRLDVGVAWGRESRTSVVGPLHADVVRDWWSATASATVRYRMRMADGLAAEVRAGGGCHLINSSSEAIHRGAAVQPERQEWAATPHIAAAVGAEWALGQARIGIEIGLQQTAALPRLPATTTVWAAFTGTFALDVTPRPVVGL